MGRFFTGAPLFYWLQKDFGRYNEIFFVPLHPNYKLSEKEDDKISHFAAYAVCAYGIRLAL